MSQHSEFSQHLDLPTDDEGDEGGERVKAVSMTRQKSIPQAATMSLETVTTFLDQSFTYDTRAYAYRFAVAMMLAYWRVQLQLVSPAYHHHCFIYLMILFKLPACCSWRFETDHRRCEKKCCGLSQVNSFIHGQDLQRFRLFVSHHDF